MKCLVNQSQFFTLFFQLLFTHFVQLQYYNERRTIPYTKLLHETEFAFEKQHIYCGTGTYYSSFLETAPTGSEDCYGERMIIVVVTLAQISHSWGELKLLKEPVQSAMPRIVQLVRKFDEISMSIFQVMEQSFHFSINHGSIKMIEKPSCSLMSSTVKKQHFTMVLLENQQTWARSDNSLFEVITIQKKGFEVNSEQTARTRRYTNRRGTQRCVPECKACTKESQNT